MVTVWVDRYVNCLGFGDYFILWTCIKISTGTYQIYIIIICQLYFNKTWRRTLYNMPFERLAWYRSHHIHTGWKKKRLLPDSA